MDRIVEIEHHGKRLLYVDLAGMQLKDKLEFYRVVERLRDRVSSAGLHSMLVVTNVTNSPFDADVARTMSSCAQFCGPYIKASAVVGLSGIQRVVFAAIKRQTKREFFVADSIDQARDWLIAQ
jgi:hypothetical protein